MVFISIKIVSLVVPSNAMIVIYVPPIQLAQANTVIPKITLLIPRIKPKDCRI